ncbi:MAG: restriction endonuclease subunit S, partial [Cyanobacteriota bacterium]|nr:restriction endonuclease subunit S [Cyanobacteriota bacterium]
FRREGRFNCTNVCGTLKAKSSTHINLDFALASLRLATRAFVRMDINPKLMNNVMASIRVPVPPKDEQVEIIQNLDKQIRGFQPLEDSIEVQVCLLQERRSALISAAVTGQIDVRGLVEAEGSE